MHKHDGQQYLPISLDADAAFHLNHVHGVRLSAGAASVHNRLHALEQDRAITLDEVTALRQKVADLEASVEARKGEATFAQQQAANRTRELDTFKEQVRETVAEFQPRYDLCDEGVNRFLDALGLAPLERDFDVTLERTQRITVTVRAHDADEAGERAVEAEDAGAYNSEWRYADNDGVTVYDTCES